MTKIARKISGSWGAECQQCRQGREVQSRTRAYAKHSCITLLLSPFLSSAVAARMISRNALERELSAVLPRDELSAMRSLSSAVILATAAGPFEMP